MSSTPTTPLKSSNLAQEKGRLRYLQASWTLRLVYNTPLKDVTPKKRCFPGYCWQTNNPERLVPSHLIHLGPKAKCSLWGHLLVSVSWCFRGLALAVPPLCWCHWRIKKALCWAQTPTHLPAAPRPGEWTSKGTQVTLTCLECSLWTCCGWIQGTSQYLSLYHRKKEGQILWSSVSRAATVTGLCSNRQSSSKLISNKKRSLTIRGGGGIWIQATLIFI